MSTTLLTPYPLSSYPTPTARFLAEAWWTCYSSPPHTWRRRCDVILSTGQPISVILPSIRDDLDLEIAPASGWKGLALTWMDVPCRVGRVTLSLPTQETPGQFRSFSLLVLLPQQDVEDAPPFIQLGAQFLMEYQVRLVLDGGMPENNCLLIP